MHPAALADIKRDTDTSRRALRELLFNKYPLLPNPPPITPQMEAVLGATTPDEQDWVDHQLIVALYSDAVDYLITEDRGLRRKATRLELQHRVATIPEAISILRDLFDTTPRPPPAVEALKAHALDTSDPIFDSFRQDYQDFDAWLRKCKREHRQTWVIKAGGSSLAGLAIVKREEPGEFGLPGKVLKLASFKVSEQYNGFRFGELLLKPVFDYARTNRYTCIYVTVFQKHSSLISLLEDFGFQELGAKTQKEELVLVKHLSFTKDDIASLDPLTFNIRYGPFAVKLPDTAAFAVPITPKYHRLLFPDAEPQLSLIPRLQPFGNSIRKAYLCNAKTRQITPGCNLFFYRSKDARGFTCLAVAEDTVVSKSPSEIARCVGKRTVYTFREIQHMCQHDVLAVLFRQSRILNPPLTLKELTQHGVLTSPPQSVVKISEEGVRWLQACLRG